jgi:cyclopropane fatty-acyl-phospholipid synthase-like methyltransferase
VSAAPGEFVLDGHLGGYIAGGDPATQYPDLWAWLVAIKGVSSVLDVGCGDGAAMYVFDQLGCDVRGVDGVAQIDPRIAHHDFTLAPWTIVDDVDLVWSCEFVEHVEEQYIGNFLAAFKRGRAVLMTHASPGQQGHHHVNCRTDDYWVGVMAATGYQLDGDLTRDTRAIASANTDPNNHYARSGLAFTRRETR